MSTGLRSKEGEGEQVKTSCRLAYVHVCTVCKFVCFFVSLLLCFFVCVCVCKHNIRTQPPSSLMSTVESSARAGFLLPGPLPSGSCTCAPPWPGLVPYLEDGGGYGWQCGEVQRPAVLELVHNGCHVAALVAVHRGLHRHKRVELLGRLSLLLDRRQRLMTCRDRARGAHA